MITDESFWQLSAEAREEQIPALNPHCFVCGELLEGQRFVWDLFMGPQMDIAGMHMMCAYNFARRILRDFAATWHLDTTDLKQFIEEYDKDQQVRAPHPPDIPAKAASVDALGA